MLGRLSGFGFECYALWGIGALGLLLKIIFSSYLSKMVKASENITTTRKKSLRRIKQKYENGKALGKIGVSSKAYVERNVRRLRLFAFPIELWRKSGKILISTCIMFMTGCFWIYGAKMLGSGQIYDFIYSGIFVVAFLTTLENIFLVSNKMELLKANLIDYFDNISSPQEKQNSFTIERVIDNKEAFPQNELDNLHNKCEKESAAAESIMNSDESLPKEEALNSFLKEFFTWTKSRAKKS